MIGFPLSIFLFFSSEEIILILYGDKWAGTIEVFRVLSLTIGFQILLSSTGAIFQSTNRTDLLFISGLISASFMVGAITYGEFAIGTLSGICFSLLIAILINFIQGFYVLIKLALKSSLWFFFKVLALPGLFTAYTFISLLLVNFMRISNLYLSLVMNTIFASLVFIALLYMNRSHFNFIGKIIKRR